MSFEKVLDFLDQGILGFAVLAIGLVVVLPMLPLIAIGWLFMRVTQAMEARKGNSPVPAGDAPNLGHEINRQTGEV